LYRLSVELLCVVNKVKKISQTADRVANNLVGIKLHAVAMITVAQQMIYTSATSTPPTCAGSWTTHSAALALLLHLPAAEDEEHPQSQDDKE